MRVKFFDYITTVTKDGIRNTNMSGHDDLPLAHGINGKQYFPINLNGNFQEF